MAASNLDDTAMASMIEGIAPLLMTLTPLLILMGAAVAMKGFIDLSIGRFGSGNKIASGLTIGGIGVGIPFGLRAWGYEKPKASKNSSPASDPTPTADPTPDSTPDSGDTDITRLGDSPLGFTGAEVLYVLGCLLALILLIALVVGGVSYARSRKRKSVEAREAAEQAKAEEEARLDRVWTESVERHDHVRDESMRHQTDIDLVLSMPVINDMSEPKTAAYIEALAKAADLAHDTRPSSAEAVEAYAKATRDAERAWGAAVRNAHLVRLSKFSPEERKTIQQVAKLMKRAEHETTPEARKSYFEQATRMLNNLIEIPAPAVEAIEQSIAGVLANPAAEDVTYCSAPSSIDGSILSTLARKARQKVTR